MKFQQNPASDGHTVRGQAPSAHMPTRSVASLRIFPLHNQPLFPRSQPLSAPIEPRPTSLSICAPFPPKGTPSPEPSVFSKENFAKQTQSCLCLQHQTAKTKPNQTHYFGLTACRDVPGFRGEERARVRRAALVYDGLSFRPYTADQPVRRLASRSRTTGTRSIGTFMTVCVVDSYAASSSASASSSDCCSLQAC